MITTVKSVKPSGKEPYQSANGLLYSFVYEFADGHKLQANHKTETAPFKEGSTVEYEITSTNKYGSLGKVKKPQDGVNLTPEHQPMTKISNLQAEHGRETQLDRIEKKLDQIVATLPQF